MIKAALTRPSGVGVRYRTVFGTGGVLLMPVLITTGAPLLASWTNVGVGIYMALVPMFNGLRPLRLGLAHVPASTAPPLPPRTHGRGDDR
ncbi:hypothetical protein OIE43_43030 [Streptomyces pseudovenezuelae]|uniref:hypothetical protein n=1 Tax=Streptomyces pseudovenezuelae TaxID=67350 RepID=UPI002E2FC85A|nr:hypothetical protein [Streptomyces pseudovenezuelae]